MRTADGPRRVVRSGQGFQWAKEFAKEGLVGVAQTKRGAVAVLDADEGATMVATGEHAARVLRVYEDLQAADKDGVPYPVILAAAEALGIEYDDEVDI